MANFQAEATNLQALATALNVRQNNALAATAKIPTALAVGGDEHAAFLLLPFIELQEKSNAAMGEALAVIHRQSGEFFGWPDDNFIGSSRQKNGRYQDWPRFWQEQRLLYQRQLLIADGQRGRFLDALEKLIADCPIFSKVINRFLRCCMAICGRAMPLLPRKVSQYFSTRLVITATAKPTWP